jgi:hypothetical protein
MLEKVPGDVASRCWSDLVAKSSHVRVDVDGLPCPLHHPTAYNRQRRGHGFVPIAILSHCVVVGDGA